MIKYRVFAENTQQILLDSKIQYLMMPDNYTRLVDLFVKPDLRDEIKILKKELTYDQFLRELIKKNKSEKLEISQTSISKNHSVRRESL